MRRALFALIVLLALAVPAYAVDDCPPGHVRHPAISSLDDASMLAAYTASFRGIWGRDPSMVPGSGVDDGWYYIRAANHYGVYGDDQCHAGWSGYWEGWITNGHGDLSLVQSPAKFLPLPPASPVPIPSDRSGSAGGSSSAATPLFDASAILTQLALLNTKVDELTRADGDAHATINQNVTDGRSENRSFFASVGSHWKSITAIAAPFVTYLTCHSTGKC